MSPRAGVVTELWRYPVKSLGGEQVGTLRLTAGGVEGDRRWAVVGADGKIGSGKTTRRFRRMPGLLSMASSTSPDGSVWLSFPDGSIRKLDDAETAAAVSRLVGEPVQLSEESGVSHLDDSPVHLVATHAISALAGHLPSAAVTVRRFRPNVVIEASGSAEWLGGSLRVGNSLLGVTKATERCVMVTMAQPGIPFAARILGEIEHRYAGCFGLYAMVETAGTISVGDEVEVSLT